jgi:hypothetical protein
MTRLSIKRAGQTDLENSTLTSLVKELSFNKSQGVARVAQGTLHLLPAHIVELF